MSLRKINQCLRLIIIILLAAVSMRGYAQRTCFSANLISWATLSPNAGIELCISHKSSLALDMTATPWSLSRQLSLRQISLCPEFRYWFNKTLYAHYIGINLLYSSYDIHFKKNEHDGNIIALGLGYGYSLMLTSRLNLIPGIGIGIGYNQCRRDSRSDGFRPVITKASITIQYVIR